MVKYASYKVRKKIDIETFSEQLTMNDVTTAIGARSNGIKIYNKREKFLSAIDSVTNTIPHSNEAAKKARRNGETLQHHFGTASYFLTINPDDETSYIVQIYSQRIIDDNISAIFQEDEDILERSQNRQQLRIEVPGICAFYFELIVEVIIEEILCWDLQKEQPLNDKVGLFGETEAFTLSIEEQARKPLHAHIQIWIKNYHHIREQIFRKEQEDKECSKYICDSLDNIASCAFFFGKKEKIQRTELSKAFHHNCNFKDVHKRKPPKVVSHQKLRNLRHYYGQLHEKEIFAICEHCNYTWTHDEFVKSYLVNKGQIPYLKEYPDDIKRLKPMCINYQQGRGWTCVKSDVINSSYNIHNHTSSCFGKDIKLINNKIQT